ncbi:MAG: TolC family protein, partial [Bacteroidia bacterium]
MLSAFAGTAQQKWNLQQCIDQALKENLQIRQSELSLQLEEANRTQSFADFFPTLNANASHNYFFGRNVDPVTNLFTTEQVQSNNFSLNSSLTIFRGLQIQNALKQSKFSHLAASYDLRTVKNDIALAVAAAYLQVLFTNELITVAEQQLQGTQEQLTRT